MKRWTRGAVEVSAVVSALLCVAVGVLWVRGYWRVDVVTRASARLDRAVSGGGGVFLESLRLEVAKGSWRDKTVPVVRSVEDYARHQEAAHVREPRWRLEPRWRRTDGLYVGRADVAKQSWGPDVNPVLPGLADVNRVRAQTFDNVDGSVTTDALVGRRLWVPYWIPFVCTAVLPLWRLRAWRRRARRARLNLCPVCGYDLRATPERGGAMLGRCPECGTTVARVTTKAEAAPT